MVVCDLRRIALAILEDDPPISLSGAQRVIAYWRNETRALLDEPRVWAAIEHLAKALVRRGYLSPRAVREVLGAGFFLGKRAS